MSDMVDSDLIWYDQHIREEEYLAEKRKYLRRIGEAKEELDKIIKMASDGHYDALYSATWHLDEIHHCKMKIVELKLKDENTLIEFDRYTKWWEHDDPDWENGYHNTFKDYGETAEFSTHKQLKLRHKERREWKPKHR